MRLQIVQHVVRNLCCYYLFLLKLGITTCSGMTVVSMMRDGIHHHHQQQQHLVMPSKKNKFATTPTKITWMIDGNNLKCFRGVPNNRVDIIRELQMIASPKQRQRDPQKYPLVNNERNVNENNIDAENDHGIVSSSSSPPICNVILVFDGDRDETYERIVSDDIWFQYVIVDGTNKIKDRADKYMIQQALPELDFESINERSNDNNMSSFFSRVHLVTADKELGKLAIASKLMNGGSIIHPGKFWSRYLPNLQRKNQQTTTKEKQ